MKVTLKMLQELWNLGLVTSACAFCLMRLGYTILTLINFTHDVNGIIVVLEEIECE